MNERASVSDFIYRSLWGSAVLALGLGWRMIMWFTGLNGCFWDFTSRWYLAVTAMLVLALFITVAVGFWKYVRLEGTVDFPDYRPGWVWFTCWIFAGWLFFVCPF